MNKIADERVFAKDANGVTRLVAAPGDRIPTEVVTAGVVQTPPEASHSEPVKGYDALTEAEVLTILPGLDAETLELVRAYEQAHRARGSITRYGLTSTPVDVPPEKPVRKAVKTETTDATTVGETATASTEETAAASTAEPPKTDYADQHVDELRAEVEKRGLEVQGSGADGNVLKKDLVAALEADDRS
jgi:hypothetical protein